jgi:hypothetical protein
MVWFISGQPTASFCSNCYAAGQRKCKECVLAAKCTECVNGGSSVPFQSGWESCSSSAPQARCLDFVDDPIPPHQHEVLGPVPVTALHRTLDERVTLSVDVGEDAVLVLETTVDTRVSLRVGSIGGSGRRRCRGGGRGGGRGGSSGLRLGLSSR